MGYDAENNPYCGYEHSDARVFPANREPMEGDLVEPAMELKGVARRLFAGTQTLVCVLNGEIGDAEIALESVDAVIGGAGRDIEGVVGALERGVWESQDGHTALVSVRLRTGDRERLLALMPALGGRDPMMVMVSAGLKLLCRQPDPAAVIAECVEEWNKGRGGESLFLPSTMILKDEGPVVRNDAAQAEG